MLGDLSNRHMAPTPDGNYVLWIDYAEARADYAKEAGPGHAFLLETSVEAAYDRGRADALRTAEAATLDVDVLARALLRVDREDGRYPMPVDGYYEGLARDVAREYRAILAGEKP
jgi:hypothetical protein